ncbi:MAG: GTP 3',8-cyclase MoaA [Desulfobulbaceae bacterium]|nr:MAG: GTP 3',8-cyclase MoaA [Desulfobulbaceae bacterium]
MTKANAHTLTDIFDRSISYLRVSLTDQCNLRCVYCTPTPLSKLNHAELLTYEELLRVIAICVDLGIRKVRLTGGEPLVRRNVGSFIEGLAKINGLEDIRLTTNGVYLDKYAELLRQAGVNKLNISLDSLRRERFREITGVDCFDQVWKNIEMVCAKGFTPVKINMVAMRGVNDDELVDFAGLSLQRPLQVRFIEFMPIGNSAVWGKEKYIPSAEIMERVQVLGRLDPLAQHRMDGPARVFKLPGGMGSIGFISPLSHKFCEQCNRLRLTSEGKLRSCLLSDQESDLKSLIRNGASDEQIAALVMETIARKPQGHKVTEGENCHGRMSRIGG